MDTNDPKPDIIWQPHPGQQTEALKRVEFEVLYGGARGGGKTDAGIAWLTREAHNPNLRALVIRRNADDLRDWIDRANVMYSRLGAVKKGNPPEFHWSSGAVFRTGHLKDEQAYTKYQGHEYQRMLLEELNQIPNERAYLRLISSCRSTIPELKPRVFATTNPGGIGHQWVKKRFIDVAPWGTPYHYVIEVAGQRLKRSRVFIHATIDDNPTLVKNDPGYVLTLEQLKHTDEELYRAWRFGDWEVFAGQVFGEFNRTDHVIKQVTPKRSYPWYLGMDWGYSGRESHEGAFAAVPVAIIREKYEGQTFNRVIQFGEFYDKRKYPDEWAEIIYNWTLKEFDEIVADSSMFDPQSSGNTPIAELFMEKWDQLAGRSWSQMRRGTKNRIGRVATLHNWLSKAPDGLPYFLVTDNCIHTIRTIPALIHDQNRVEDVDTEGEDHLYDALTYILSRIKWIPIRKGGISLKKDKRKELMQPDEALDLSVFEKAKAAKKRRDWRA